MKKNKNNKTENIKKYEDKNIKKIKNKLKF